MNNVDKTLPRAEVNHDRCMGTSMCMHAAPRAFHLNSDGQAEFHDGAPVTLAELHEAATSCPMAAITVIEK